ncbi:MAG: GNAT family N-acetyltransferase [Acidimicrobiales bacterium]
MLVRERTDEDLDDCVRMAHAVQELDRYPTFLPTDLRRFLSAPDALLAWVAEQDGEIIGHVALRSGSNVAVLAAASDALKVPTDRLGVVARLFVSPEHRRQGVARTLLEVACQEAHSRGLWPILDVVIDQKAAIALYESNGWVRAGQVTSRYGDDIVLEEFVYLGPQPPSG